jgi:hypothetical protein
LDSLIEAIFATLFEGRAPSLPEATSPGHQHLVQPGPSPSLSVFPPPSLDRFAGFSETLCSTFFEAFPSFLSLSYSFSPFFFLPLTHLSPQFPLTYFVDLHPELIRFGRGIERDKAPVQAALTRPESNGVVEGHVHRLKLIKRRGYGRASFSLLRQRVLSRAS